MYAQKFHTINSNLHQHNYNNEVVERRVKGKDFWGPHFWRTIHCAAAAYKPENEKEFRDFIMALGNIIPCDSCKQNWWSNLEKIPMDKYLSNNHDLFFWTYIIHDIVNKEYNSLNPNSPKKISPDFYRIKAQYFSALNEDCKACKL